MLMSVPNAAGSGESLSPALRRAAGPSGLAGLVQATAPQEAPPPRGLPTLPTQVQTPAAREPGRQENLGRLQQGLDYLDRLGESLQALKQDLGRSLAGLPVPPAALEGRLESLRQQWQQRPQRAAGMVDGQLQAASPDAPARQRFKLRGLDLAMLEQGGRETLRLQLPGQATADGRAAQIAVTLDGEGSPQQLQALARALGPAGLQVQAQGGELLFSVAEAQWPALRDGLTLRGEGRRFPGGQALRAPLETPPEALQPQRWSLDDATGQRRALGELLQAQPRLAQARTQLQTQLQDLDAAVPATVSAAQAGRLADDLERALQDGGYAGVGALLPALRGLHKDRVRQLLG